jgi:hypothetical protein
VAGRWTNFWDQATSSGMTAVDGASADGGTDSSFDHDAREPSKGGGGTSLSRSEASCRIQSDHLAIEHGLDHE